jgi:hypothetical protein
MTSTDSLIALERAGWEALSTSGDAAAAHYADVLATDVLMLLPGGLVIDDRDEVIHSMSGAPWDGYELRDERVVVLGDGAALLAYRGAARRGDQEYDALFASVYVREDGAWRLAVHQQTPA